jgi:uncharacterized protein
MRINLLEIPNEGKSYICNNQTGEFTELLSDLIGTIPHKTEFALRPLEGGTFELTGFVQTELPDQCSRCGLDFNLRIDEIFKEILMPELEQPRNAKYAKANHFSDLKTDVPSVVEYQGHHFDMGEYLHEVVGLSQPYSAAPTIDEKGDCSLCMINMKEKNFNYDEDFVKPESPFSALKNVKLN